MKALELLCKIKQQPEEKTVLIEYKLVIQQLLFKKQNEWECKLDSAKVSES